MSQFASAVDQIAPVEAYAIFSGISGLNNLVKFCPSSNSSNASQQDRWNMSISISQSIFVTSRLSSIEIPMVPIFGDILTATRKLSLVFFRIERMISFKNLNLFSRLPPNSSFLRFVFRPRNCEIRYECAP